MASIQNGVHPTFQIGELAKRTAVRIDAIRFYERRELLPRAFRSAGRFRLYTTDDIERLRFVQRTQRLGFSLEEIKRLMAIRADKAHACAAVRQFLKTKLDSVTAKIREFRRLETELKADLGKCNRALKRQRGKTCACPVLEEIERTNNVMKIEWLYFEGCPNHLPAMKVLREILDPLCREEQIHEVDVRTQAEAEAIRFVDSPSIRINGSDIEPWARTAREFGLSCRTYLDGPQHGGVPSRELLRCAIMEAIHEGC
jgi:DNA-binding transcriptional MerR regulator